MREYSAATAQLLDAVVGIGRRHAEVELPTTDIVHFDFNPTNILVSQELVSGVVDWDGACSGDCAFDLATLLFYTYEQAGVRERLWRALSARTSLPRAATAYMAVFALGVAAVTIWHLVTGRREAVRRLRPAAS